MHIECARRAEYHMKFDPEIDTQEFLCMHHTPLPLCKELKQSLDEQIKGITDFADSYQLVLRESEPFFEWTEKEKTELFKKVADSFFAFSRLGLTLTCKDKTFALQSGLIEAEDEGEVGLFQNNQDWKITLDFKAFPWQSITVEDHDPIDCWKKYWEIIGLSELKFK
jgi:hypothetical protein